MSDFLTTPLESIHARPITDEQRDGLRDYLEDRATDILAMLFPDDDQPRLGHIHGTKRRAAQKHRARVAKGVRHG